MTQTARGSMLSLMTAFGKIEIDRYRIGDFVAYISTEENYEDEDIGQTAVYLTKEELLKVYEFIGDLVK